MAIRVLPLLLAMALLAAAGEKKRTPSTAHGENMDVIVTVTLYDDPALVKELLGTDLDGHYTVASVKIDPKYGKDIVIDRDDFVLRTDKDGDHTTPFSASQITGKNVIIISQTKGAPAASPGMVLGGPLVVRGGTSSIGGGEAKVATPGDSKEGSPPAEKQEDPLEKLLSDKILPEKKTNDSVSGLLYFPMEKQKRKDLELDYGPRDNRIELRFK
jgi:hypothetical protein